MNIAQTIKSAGKQGAHNPFGANMKTESKTKPWDHKDEWRKAGTNFLVTVTRHSEKSLDPHEGPNRWAVYAYIYPKHPHFSKFDGPNMWQEATQLMPLHGGASMLEYPMYDGKVTSVKVGADYNHLHDCHGHDATQEDASDIFADAYRLYDWLQARAIGSEFQSIEQGEPA